MRCSKRNPNAAKIAAANSQEIGGGSSGLSTPHHSRLFHFSRLAPIMYSISPTTSTVAQRSHSTAHMVASIGHVFLNSRASQPACRPRLYHVDAPLLLLNGFRNRHVRWLLPLFRVLSTVWGVWGLDWGSSAAFSNEPLL